MYWNTWTRDREIFRIKPPWAGLVVNKGHVNNEDLEGMSSSHDVHPSKILYPTNFLGNQL